MIEEEFTTYDLAEMLAYFKIKKADEEKAAEAAARRAGANRGRRR